MKYLFSLILTFVSFQMFSQSFIDPGDDLDCTFPCFPPVLAANAPLVDAADRIGKALQGDPCGDYTYAHQLVCTVVESVADLLPCMYHSSTPQGSLCGSGDQPGEPTVPEEPSEPAEPNEPIDPEPTPPAPPEADDPQIENYYATSYTRPFVRKYSAKSAKMVYDNFKQIPLGKPYKLAGGLTLVPIRAERDPNNSTHWVILYRIVNSKGQTVGNPILISRNGKLVLWDIASKKKSKSNKSKYRRK